MKGFLPLSAEMSVHYTGDEGRGMMKKIVTMLLLLLLALPCAAEEFYTQMPELLRFTQQTLSETVSRDAVIHRTYPDTVNDAVDAEMRAAIDSMAEKNREKLPSSRGTAAALDVGAYISRSGESLLSFLIVAEVSSGKEQLSVDFGTRVYDTATGKRVTLGDLFADEAAYTLLENEARAVLTAAFPAMEADGAALDALVGGGAIRDVPFTLGAARLTLTFRADSLYPGKNTLLHVNIGYSRLREFMTEYGLAQTDNSRFQMVALTYDDGPNRGATSRVLDALRAHGAQATFFVVGDRFKNNHDMLAREQDGNFSIQSHTYTHRYPDQMQKGEAQREKERMAAELGELIGVPPTMMRAPGGHAAYYAIHEIGYPLIQWALASGDSGNPHVDKIAQKVIASADDGEIVLMHDLNGGSPVYTERILKTLTQRGFLFVTVEELFEDAGAALEENVIYYAPGDIREK